MSKAAQSVFAHPTGLLGRLAGRVMARSNRDVNAWTVELLGLTPGESVLDVGAGPGVGLEWALERIARGRAVGVDPSPAMLGQARRRHRRDLRRGRLALVRAPAERLPWRAPRFDAAYSVNSVLSWDAPERAFRELARVLRPDGRAAVTFQGRSLDGRAELARVVRRLERALSASGFRPVCVARTRIRARPAICLLARRATAPSAVSSDPAGEAEIA